MMNLQELFSDIPSLKDASPPPIDVSFLTVDSRETIPGALFIAVCGVNADGHQFLHQAAENGAVAAIGEKPADNLPIPYFRVSNSRRVFSELAAAWYGYPARQLTLLGVTGTDGKTTTVNLLYQMMKAAGLRAGMISTVNAVVGDRVMDTGLHVTTPDPMEVQALLADMVQAGLTHAVLEVTSHGLAQHRVLPDDFRVAILTNITHEHLDYHGSYQAYHDAKAMLFRVAYAGAQPKVCVINKGDQSYDDLSRTAQGRVIGYGTPCAEYRAEDVRYSPSGLHAVLAGPAGKQAIDAHLLGEYNVQNILAAYAAAVEGLGISPGVAVEGIAALPGIPGRMEIIEMGQPFLAVVDFAHTPNALQVTLETCRDLCEGRVIAVFGSAGLRDREKRRMMAEVSVQAADMTVLTAEDPRTEDLDRILAEMAEGAVSAGGEEGETFLRVADRGDAISCALQLAAPGDLVVACGKGHEQSMCFGEEEYPWDDRTAMRAALAQLIGVTGPAMPFLPTQG